MNGGFDGELSELRYFSKAITGLELMKLAEKGPNMREYSKWGLPTPPYLSQRWFRVNAAASRQCLPLSLHPGFLQTQKSVRLCPVHHPGGTVLHTAPGIQ